MESLSTRSTESAEGQTFPRTCSGVAERQISATGGEITQGRSGVLSDEERIRLARIRKDRRLGWMQSFSDTEFLLELLSRLGL
jgi:hypothetical protein